MQLPLQITFRHMEPSAAVEGRLRARTARLERYNAPHAEHVVRAVFKVLAHHVTAGEIEDVKQLLPKDLRDLWPE